MPPRHHDETDSARVAAAGMRSYWDDRARENAVWYVDTSMDYEAPDMERFLATGPEVVRQALLDAPVQPAGRQLAVEIGCGLGRICLALSAHFSQVVGLDISASMVEQARSLVDAKNVRFEVASGADLASLGDGTVDFITSYTVFQHMPHASLIESYVRDAARVLRPGGVLATQWNNLPHPLRWRLRGRWWRLRQRIGGPLKIDARAAPEFVGMRVPEGKMLDMITRAGLTVQGTASTGTLFAWVWATKA